MSTPTRTRKHRSTLRQGEVRRVNVNGREKLAFPLTPLLEKVYQYPEWDRAEYLPDERLHESTALWSDIPIFVDHPDSFAADTTADDPDAFEEAVIGRGYAPEIIAHEHSDGETSAKLRINEARIDFDVAQEKGGAVWETVRRVDNGHTIHVSPGYSTIGDEKEHGSYRGEEYSVRQGAVMPDHIALVPPGATGRCTPQEGCAAPRMNSLGSAGEQPPAASAAMEDTDVMSTQDTDPDVQQDEHEREREHKSVAGVSFTGTANGKLDKSALDPDEHTLSDHYLFGSGDTKDDYSYPVVDANSTLRKGNVAAAHQLGARGGVSADELESKLKSLNKQWSEGSRPIDFDAKENILTADDAAVTILGYDVARENAIEGFSQGDIVRWTKNGETVYGEVVREGPAGQLGPKQILIAHIDPEKTGDSKWLDKRDALMPEEVSSLEKISLDEARENSIVPEDYEPGDRRAHAEPTESDRVRWEDRSGAMQYGIVIAEDGDNISDDEVLVALYTQSNSSGNDWERTDIERRVEKSELSVLSGSFPPSTKQNQEQADGGADAETTSALIGAYHRLVDAVTTGGGGTATAADDHLHSSGCTRSGPGGTCSCGLHEHTDGETEAETENGEVDDSEVSTDTDESAEDRAHDGEGADADDGSAEDSDADSDEENDADSGADTEDSTMSDTTEDGDEAQGVSDRIQRLADATNINVETLQNMSAEELDTIENGVETGSEDDEAETEIENEDGEADDGADDPSPQAAGQPTGADTTDEPGADAAGPSDTADAEKVHKMEERLDALESENEALREKVEAPENAKRAAAREHVAEQYGIDPDSLEGMDDDALAQMAQQTGMTFDGEQGGQRAAGTGVSLNGGSRENTLPPSMQPGANRGGGSPSADMRGAGGTSSAGGGGEEETEREHSESEGRGGNGYPEKGFDAWQQRGQ